MAEFLPGRSEKLVQYLDGELTGEELRAFETEIQNDAGLKAELESLQATRQAIRLQGIKQQVKAIHPEMMKAQAPIMKMKAPVRRILRYSISVAATLLLIVVGIMAYNFYTLSPAKVYTAHFQSYELNTTRDTTQVRSAVEAAYRQKNYEEVNRIITTTHDSSIQTLFLGGMSRMEQKNNTRAIKLFSRLLAKNKASGQRDFNDEAEYYLALSYVRDQDYDLALAILEKIKDDPSHRYHSKVSRKFLRQLRWLKWR